MPATPVVPETITVHLGPPGSSARNMEVPFAAYIKNVASHEIYPTWPESAIRANILAQISYALNRVYTEYYRARGYDYDITSTTQYDQAYVDGGDVFDNISKIVDDSFNNYIVRQDSVEPLFAQFCDGVRTQCGGLSQWGSVDLARDGMNPYEILQYYYGGDISIVFNAPVGGNVPSYPGRPLRRGDVGNDVLLLQRQLSRIRRNYPAIPEIPEPSTVFDVPMEEAVKSQKKGSVLHVASQRAILDADIAADDSICYLSSEPGYKSVLYVYNSQQSLIYRWLSASQYFMRCAVASGSKYAAAAVLGQQDGMFESSVVLFRTDAEEIACTIPIGNAMIYDLHFVSDSKLCVLAEDALSFYDLDGNLLGSFSYGESYLKDYTTDGSGCLTLVMNLYQAGNRYTVLTVGYDGAELGRLSSGEQILDISAAGKYLAILTSSSLSIYDQTLQEYDVSDNTAGAASVVMRADGSAILLANGHGTLYVP